MIDGAHVVIYSTDAGADRAFLRDVLRFGDVDAGEGWLIFGLPPAEVAVHPAETGGRAEFYLMCDDVEAERERLLAKGAACSEISDEGWGLLMHLSLPGGGRLGVYQPRHARP